MITLMRVLPACVVQGTLLLLPLLRHSSEARLSMKSNIQAALVGLLLLGVLQLLLLRKHLGVYLRYRHCITLSNRLLRASVAFLPVLNRGSDIMTKWGDAGQQSVAAALALYAFFPSLMHLHVRQ
jgi:hypothetical protein